jgi:ABC-type branched-subunit amino acid transport system ATPase component
VALLGRNGMGKTMTIRSIIRFTPPQKGEFRFKGKESGFSILLVEQNYPMALRVADYDYIISKGVIVYESTIDELKKNEEVRIKYLCATE